MPTDAASSDAARSGTGVGAAGPGAASSAWADADLLLCGRRVAALVDQADAGRLEPVDDHQTGCQHCRAALRDAALSGQALALLRDSTGPVPAGLVGRVMREVRRHRPPGALIELGPAAGRSRRGPELVAVQVAGGIRVHSQVIADLARIAATGVRGVTVAWATATATATATGQPDQPDQPGESAQPDRPDGVDQASGASRAGGDGRVGGAGRAGSESQVAGIEVALGLLVDGRTPLPELAQGVRRAVRAAVRRATGTDRVEVALTALDLLPET